MSVWLAILTVLFMAVGCTRYASPPRAVVPQPPTQSTVAPPQAAQICPVGQIDVGEGCKPCAQLKPCFHDAGQMHFVAEAILPTIVDYYRDTYGSDLPSPRWFVIATGGVAQTRCGMLESWSTLQYCPPDDVIFIGEDAMWHHYNLGSRGDAINAVIMAHESAHHIQSVLGMLQRLNSRAMQIRLENQADCMSGAIAKFMHDKGFFSMDDLKGVERFIPTSGQDGQNRTHGTDQERIEAFNTGYRQGVIGCDDIGFAKISPS